MQCAQSYFLLGDQQHHPFPQGNPLPIVPEDDRVAEISAAVLPFLWQV